MTDSVETIEMVETRQMNTPHLSIKPTYYSLYRKKILAQKNNSLPIKLQKAKEIKLAEKDAEKQAKHQTDKQDKIIQKNKLKKDKITLDMITKQNQNTSIKEWNLNRIWK